MNPARWVLGVLLSATLFAEARFAVQVPEVPEPGTIVLMGAGLVGMGLFAWRRSRGSK